MLILDIDYREYKIIQMIDPNITTISVSNTIYGPVTYNNIEFYYKVSNLPMGDFVYKCSDNNDVYYIIERKSISDLESSIKDGRFREQKQRLSASNANIIYIIEGMINTIRKCRIPKTTLKSSIINLQVNHKFLVFKTECEKDTLEYLLLLYNKIKENGIEFTSKQVTFKKKDSTSSTYVNQLTMIGGVSKIVALKIVEHYKTLILLINAYNTNDKATCESLLANIQINDKRKIGKVLSKKIYYAFMDANDKDTDEQNEVDNTGIEDV